jgi:PAS domain S-box-containing protein
MAKILIVDDRALNRQFLTALLGYAGHQLSEAVDGAEALAKIRGERPDLVITDLLMPTMDGFQLVQQMRAEPAIADTAVIFYSATFRLQEASELARACGVSVVIPKPSEPQIILDAVSAQLAPRESRSFHAREREAVAGIRPTSQLKEDPANYFLDLKLLRAQVLELIEQSHDPAEREALLLPDVPDKVRRSMNDLQAVSLKLATILELGLELTQHRDPQRLLELFCRAATDIMGAKYGALAILDDNGESLAYFVGHANDGGDATCLKPLFCRAGVLSELLQQAKPRRLQNPSGDPQDLGLASTHPPIHSFLGVSIISTLPVQGWFYVVDKIASGEFTQADEQMVVTLTAQLAVAFQRVKLYDELQRHAAKLELESERRRRAEEKFSSAIEAAPNGMLMVDATEKMILVNRKLCEYFGYETSELIGQSIEILIPERLRRKHPGHVDNFFSSPQNKSMGAGRDLIGRRKDGSEFPVEIGISSLATNEGVMALASLIDISERKKAETALRERVRTSEFIAEISGALATNDDLRPVLQRCAEAAVQHLDAAFARIWILNPRENVLELRASAGLYTHIDGCHSRIPVGQFNIGLIALERRPHLTNAVVGDARVDDPKWIKREGMVGFAGYPLLVDRRLVGVIAIFSRQAIPAPILEVMASGATEIAVGIERKVAEARAREHFDRIRALHEIDRAITSTLDLQSVLAVILDSIAQLFPPAAAVGIALRDHGTGALEPVACRGMVREEWKRAFFTGESFINASALIGPLVIPDLHDDPRLEPAPREFFEKSGYESLLVVPIQIDDRILGLMGFTTIVKYNFSSNEIEFFSTLAGQAAVAIQNADLYEQTRKQAVELAERECIQRILKELSQNITKMDVDTLLEKLTITIREIFKVDISDVRFLAGAKWANIIVTGQDLVHHLTESNELRGGATDWVVKTRKPIAIYDYLEQKEFTPGRISNIFGVRGFLAAPLLSKNGDVMGVIRALSKEPRTFTAQEIDLFEQFASGAAIAIENAQLYRDLEKSNKIKSEFLSVVSHELRTPLNIIMGYASLAKEEMASKGLDEPNNAFRKIEAQSTKLLAMVNAIMQATEIEAGAAAVTGQGVDPAALLEELRAMYDSQRSKDLAFVWKTAEGLPMITTDCEKLKHILQNLIDNAIKFTASGTVTISAHLAGEREASIVKREPRNTPNEIRDTRYVEFMVQDTGIGIAEENLPFIFDIFKQVDGSATRPYEGVGLGLFIVKKQCDLLGGTVTAESEVGKGSKFTVTLPVDRFSRNDFAI